jgi:hypothetical protein
MFAASIFPKYYRDCKPVHFGNHNTIVCQIQISLIECWTRILFFFFLGSIYKGRKDLIIYIKEKKKNAVGRSGSG